MISQTMQEAFNTQINHELYSAYLYLSMSAYFESINLPGSAKWMRVQHGEEQEHGMKMFDFVIDRGGRVTLQAISQPPADFRSPVAAWETVLEHEQKVTGLIHRLYEQAVAEHDYASQAMLTWFITEQVEEEKNASTMLGRYKAAGSNAASLLILDSHFVKRED